MEVRKKNVVQRMAVLVDDALSVLCRASTQLFGLPAGTHPHRPVRPEPRPRPVHETVLDPPVVVEAV
jgi:hypothetical protein